jgi:CheY-like chemotaxis protein
MTPLMPPEYTVLVVDDNPRLREFLCDALRELGDFRVIIARDGIEALEQYYEQRPDCMVIDVKMPGLNGYQLVRALRGDPETLATPLILLTALARDVDEFAGLAAGADRYLRKPVDPFELVQAIYAAIQLSHEEREQRFQQFVDDLPNNL